MKLIYCLPILCLFLACHPKDEELADGKFLLEGSIEGMRDGAFYLIGEPKNDTITVKNEKFSYLGNLSEPAKKYVLLPSGQSGNSGFNIFLEPTKMTLQIDQENLANSMLMGSKSNEEYQKLYAQLDSLDTKYEALINKAIMAYGKMGGTGDSSPAKEDLASIDSLEWFMKLKDTQILNFIKENPNSYVSLDALSEMSQGTNTSETEKSFYALSENLQNTKIGEKLKNQFKNRVSGNLGDLANDFTATSFNGEDFSLEDYKGKYVLLDFWASWCIPCRESNPHLKEMYKKYKPKGFEVIGISDDANNIAAWKKAMKKDGITIWRNTLRNGKNQASDNTEKDMKSNEVDIADSYAVVALPTTIIINPNGEIVYRNTGGGLESDEMLEEKLKEFFGY